jgi:hypothetical protein
MCNIPEKDKVIIDALEEDLKEINEKYGLNLSFRYQDWHDNYELDEYDTYRIVTNDEYDDTIGAAMSREQLDYAMCVLSNFFEYMDWVNKKNDTVKQDISRGLLHHNQ